MKQHAIPQNILDIEFKLFSKFTIKEFVYIAAGVSFGGIFLFLFANGRMPGIIAIPLFILFTGLGLFFGIVKINDQKADVYFKNFIVAITNPTLRVWRSKYYDQKVESKLVQESAISKKGDIIGADLTSSPIKEFAQSSDELLDNSVKEKLDSIEEVAKDLDNIQPGQVSQQQRPIISAPTVITTPEQSQSTTTVTPIAAQAPTSIPDPTISPNVTPTITPTQPPIEPTIEPQQTLEPQAKPDELSTDLTQQLPLEIIINKATINKYQYVPQTPLTFPNTITIILHDRNNAPISKAVAMVKNADGAIIQAKVSDENGLISVNKELQNGIYYVEIQHPEHLFPRVKYELEGIIYNPIIISESINKS